MVIRMYQLVRAINKFFKTSMYDYCNIESNDPEDKDKSTFITKDGGLCTVYKIGGTSVQMGPKTFSESMLRSYSSLSGLLKKQGHKIQFVFTRDQSYSVHKVSEMISSMKDTSNRLSLEFNALLDEKQEVMSRKTVYECGYMVVSTLPGAFHGNLYKTEVSNRANAVKDYGIGIKPGEFAQSPFFALVGLRQIHDGFCDSLCSVLGDISLIKKLDCHSALRDIRIEINGASVNQSWSPNLLGDKVPMRLVKESRFKSDSSHFMNPGIGHQLFNFHPSIHPSDSSLVALGGTVIAPLLVDIPPQDVRPFSELFEKIHQDIPWRWSFTIETGHNSVQSKIGTKNNFATFLAMFSSDNKLIKDAASEILAMVRVQGEVLVMCNMSICTWANDIDEANRRKQIISQAVTGWGNCDVVDENGDAVEAWINSIPALSGKNIGTTYASVLGDALAMLPLARPVSPWDSGTVLLRTMDSKVFPFLPGSSIQTSWVDIFFAPPGFGKSFFLAAMNMALILKPGYKVLPKITIIDIGFSSAAFVNLIKSSLPDHLKYQAEAFKIEMTKEYAVNPFDTPLGCQYPLTLDRDLLRNLLTLLLTPAGENSNIEMLAEVVGKIIDETYVYFSEDKYPIRYDTGTDTKIDELLINLNFSGSYGKDPSWWQVVRFLSQKTYYVEAGLAQRYAVPTINDISTVITRSSNIKDVFGKVNYNGRSILDFINSMLASVTSEFPVLCSPSRFDLGNARICSIDLSSVAKGGSAQGNKQVGVMYMLARFLCKDFYRGEDILDQIPDEYRAYHKEIFTLNATVPKKLCMDEFHRTRPCRPVRDQVIVDGREGRKFDVHLSLLSQMVDDFDDELLEIVNNIFILSKGNSEETIVKIMEKFKPTPDSIKALRAYVNGPGREGSSMLMLSRIKGGKDVEQVLRLTLGPIEIWAYSTTYQDVRLREKISQKVGLDKALRILAKEFPGGSSTDYLSSRSSKAKSLDDIGSDVYDMVTSELVAKYAGL